MEKKRVPHRVAVFVLGVVVVVLAGLTAICGEQAFDKQLAVAIGLALAVVAAGLLGGALDGWSTALAAMGIALVLLAIYLPEVGADGAVEDWFGHDAGAGDRLDAVALARWVLVVVGVVLVLWPGRKVVLEAALTAVAVLALVAVVAAVIDLADRVTTPEVAEIAKADGTRSFVLPAGKVQSLTGDLAADACVDVVLVRSVDEDTADEGNALTYIHSTYRARLPAQLAAGKPASAVEVELKEASSAGEFATDLTAARAAYVLGCPG